MSSDDTQTRLISLRVSPRLWDRLDEMATAADVPLATYARMLLVERLAQMDEGRTREGRCTSGH